MSAGTSDHPRRRSTDRGWRRVARENWYRDVWLLIITIVVWISINNIQANRRESVRLSCEQTNEIHDNVLIQIDRQSIKALGFKPSTHPPTTHRAVVLRTYDRELAAALHTPKAKRSPRYKQILASQGSTRVVIDALAPHRDCDQRVRELVN